MRCTRYIIIRDTKAKILVTKCLKLSIAEIWDLLCIPKHHAPVISIFLSSPERLSFIGLSVTQTFSVATKREVMPLPRMGRVFGGKSQVYIALLPDTERNRNQTLIFLSIYIHSEARMSILISSAGWNTPVSFPINQTWKSVLAAIGSN